MWAFCCLLQGLGWCEVFTPPHPSFQIAWSCPSFLALSWRYFWTTQPFVTKLGMVVHHYEVKCHGLLSSRSRKGTVKTCIIRIWLLGLWLLNNDSFATKLSLMVDRHKPKWPMNILGYCVTVTITAKVRISVSSQCTQLPVCTRSIKPLSQVGHGIGQQKKLSAKTVSAL